MENSNQTKQYPKVIPSTIKDFVDKKIHILGIFYIEDHTNKMIVLFMTEDSNDIFKEVFARDNLFASILDNWDNNGMSTFDVIVRSTTPEGINKRNYYVPQLIN